MPVSHHVGEDELRLALQTVLGSETFTRSQQLSRLLKYLCDALITHGADRIAEYTIGTEALGRPSDFDPTQDAAVRVEMHRLRRRLRDYYEAEGAQDTIRIVIPPGRYAPVVMRIDDELKEEAPAAIVPAREAEPPVAPAAPGRQIDGRRTGIQPLLLAAIAAAIVLPLSAWLLWRPARVGTGGGRGETVRASAGVPMPLPQSTLRIGCGRTTRWADRLGQVWEPDEFYEGGRSMQIPARSYIAGAFDPRLYESARAGSFSYKIPLPARTYEMRLYFIEPVFGPQNAQGGEGNRLFDISINGQTVLHRFDILADADGPWTADVRVFKDISPAPDGYVYLDFRAIYAGTSTPDALVNAIEFVPARPHILNPIRLLPQDNFYTDSAGNLWTPDNYSTGGRISTHPGDVRNTRDQELFRHERFGRFRYAIPVGHGSYSVYLYMAEEYWGPGNPGGGGAGTRVFSVFCNGEVLARDIDLYREVGTNYATVMAFHHLKPNAQGKLLLSFEPEHDYASLYGLEVLDEAGPDQPSYQRTLIDSQGTR
jgi:Malectin domain